MYSLVVHIDILEAVLGVVRSRVGRWGKVGRERREEGGVASQGV